MTDQLPRVESCREWVEEKLDRCNERAILILWGKLFPPEALGPRCYDHALRYMGVFPRSEIETEQWAVYDLRPVNALHAGATSGAR